MVMSRFEQNEGETAAFVTATFLDLKEFDSLTENDKETARTFIKETIHSQLTCCRKGMWEQFHEWIPVALRRLAQRHIHPVVPGKSYHDYQLPESIRHEFEVLNELAWLLTWKHKKNMADASEEERHAQEHVDLDRVQRIKEHVLPVIAEKIARMQQLVTEEHHHR
ncbi:MAG: hypothetical protein HW380_881 [Magnetococcales bacterium]|nr:hypothetical protein [Magnetococcales bacterium]HIJ83211.1 hypothetical protein [Magnetococcales bacterium]